MNFRNKYTIAIILVIILMISFSYYYFSSLKKVENTTSEGAQMTEEQKLGILSATSDVPAYTVSDTEKNNILNQIDTKSKPIDNLSNEEILQILNKTN